MLIPLAYCLPRADILCQGRPNTCNSAVNIYVHMYACIGLQSIIIKTNGKQASIRCDKGSDTAKNRKVMSILKRKYFVSGSGSLLSFLHILRYNKSKDKRK